MYGSHYRRAKQDEFRDFSGRSQERARKSSAPTRLVDATVQCQSSCSLVAGPKELPNTQPTVVCGSPSTKPARFLVTHSKAIGVDPSAPACVSKTLMVSTS